MAGTATPSGAVSTGSNPAVGTAKRPKFEHYDKRDLLRRQACDLRQRSTFPGRAPHTRPESSHQPGKARSAQVAPAALSSTFATSLAGVVTFSVLAAHQHGSVAPNWPTGIALGAGGLAGGYVGARMHARMPETIIRRLLALVVIAIGIRYLVGGLTGGA